jgi:putative sterol carrier protein
MSQQQVSPAQLFEAMPQYFQPDKASGTNATIQFDLSGDEAGKWWVKIADGTCASGEGEIETPNLTLIADAGDAVKILTGQMDGTSAFMQGKLKLKGDMGLAMRLTSLFRRPT